MNFRATIDIMPHKELLDPQGKTVEKNMKNVDLGKIKNVRIGKHVVFELEANDEKEANEMVDLACRKMLVNVIMETYHFELTPLN